MRLRILSRAATTAILTAALAGASAGCGAYVSSSGRVYVRLGPPAPLVETRVVSPGPGYVWVPGYYTWDGRAYAWSRGRWERPPRARARWVKPHWAHDRRGYYFVEGHWR
ncbi:MAG: YXWGXW repeat-containing protein [Vicinamibacterales bacterium]